METNLNGTPLDSPAPKRKRRWALPLVTLGAGAFIGALVGGAGGSDSHEAHGPVPTETVTAAAPTETVTAEPEVRTETVEVTPQSCLEYIRHTEESFTYIGQVFTAIDEGDIAGLQSAAAGVQSKTDDVLASKAACRGAGV